MFLEPDVWIGKVNIDALGAMTGNKRKSIGARGNEISGRLKKPDIHQQSRPRNQNQTDRCN